MQIGWRRYGYVVTKRYPRLPTNLECDWHQAQRSNTCQISSLRVLLQLKFSVISFLNYMTSSLNENSMKSPSITATVAISASSQYTRSTFIQAYVLWAWTDHPLRVCIISRCTHDDCLPIGRYSKVITAGRINTTRAVGATNSRASCKGDNHQLARHEG